MASGGPMNFHTQWTLTARGIYEIDLWIKGRKLTHAVNVIEVLNDNIIGIDFMHKHKLTYDEEKQQVKFIDTHQNSLSAVKQTVLPAFILISDQCEISWIFECQC
jgi:hypothetical protein